MKRWRWLALGAATLALAAASGCSTLGYYAQAVGGHFDVLHQIGRAHV